MLRHGIFLHIFMVRLFLILSLFLTSCSKQSQVTTEPSPIVESPKPLIIPHKVLWINKSIASDISESQNIPILLYVFDNKYGESIKMDMSSFQDSEVASFINQNFAAVRGGYAELNGQLPPTTIVLLNHNAEIIASTVGYLEPDELLSVLKRGLEIKRLLDEKRSAKSVSPHTL